ncbi:DUF4136 domain-containing protein [Gilvimarinus sp. SDUM040013]|uniref:DUF4136 domain-containing protein n=1 Tax=Gilvimarinus gilvus TaxID=3058038 RepID=A0ABU4S246_9GAMM|nr:DUF4136 domain-containing protein [Gilvimarinus sp. SDUM040013]MDO3384731.1 DUF4136 domain-containing protein [Gilvimarinus sp. SDUM040013]MDX6850451.1 DUF4136 domain-containing protein [Gilvimarinus sp. SDUM040013]
MKATGFLYTFRTVITGALLSALVLATGCATGPDIRSDFDKNADFRSYKTFGFVDPLGTDKHGYSSLVTSHFKSAARNEMEALGYTYNENDPELLVNFFMNTENRTEIRSSPRMTASYGYYGYRSGLYMGFPVYESDTETRHYKMGTLNIDVVDASEERLIWEGIAEGKLSKEALDNPRPAIHSAVKQIFQQYPTAPKAAE